MRAAVLQEVNGKVEIRDDVVLNDIGATEVKVQIRATGVCHSDLSAINGTLPQPIPCVLGHEGAGVITEVGSAVTVHRRRRPRDRELDRRRAASAAPAAATSPTSA